MLGLAFLLLVFLLNGRALWLVLLDVIGLGSRFKSLAQREISVDNHIAISLLVLLPWPENNHLTRNLRVRVRSQEIFGGEFVNKDFLHHCHVAFYRNIVLEHVTCLVQRHALVAASVKV